MSEIRRSLIFLLLLSVILATTGCAAQTDEANQRIAQANVLIENANALEAEIAELMTQVEAVDPNSKDATDAQPLLAQAQAKLGEQTQNSKGAVEKMNEVTELDVSNELKTYAGQQKEIAQLSVELSAITNEVLGKLKVLYDPARIGKMSESELDDLEQQLDELTTRGDELDARIGEKQSASERYFEDNSLGQ